MRAKSAAVSEVFFHTFTSIHSVSVDKEHLIHTLTKTTQKRTAALIIPKQDSTTCTQQELEGFSQIMIMLEDQAKLLAVYTEQYFLFSTVDLCEVLVCAASSK